MKVCAWILKYGLFVISIHVTNIKCIVIKSMHSRKLFVKVETSDGSVFDVWFILNVNMASWLINQSGLLEAIHIADHSCETHMHTFYIMTKSLDCLSVKLVQL